MTQRQTTARPARLLYVQAPGYPRAGLVDRLRPAGYDVTMTGDAADALRRLADDGFAICLVDLAGGRGSLTTVRLLRARHASLPIAGVVDPASPALATEAVHAGLVDLLTWPFDPIELMTIAADGRDRAPSGPGAPATDGLVAFSPAMRDLLRQVREIATTPQAVCLVGPHGTGKQLVARALHDASAGAPGPCVVLDCADRSASDLEVALFGLPPVADDATATGVERLSGSSALARARGGTLVLRHVDEASSRVQLRLADLLRDQEATIDRSDRPVDLDVRVVATQTPAGDRDGRGLLHRELAARFAVHLQVPTLRRRREDIPMLAARCLDQRAAFAGQPPLRLSRAVLELLAALPWPGNVPELERTVEAVCADTRRPVVQIEDLLRHVSLDGVPKAAGRSGLREAREQFERECIEAALARHQGRVGEAARALGIQRTNLYRKVRQLGISRSLLSSQR